MYSSSFPISLSSLTVASGGWLVVENGGGWWRLVAMVDNDRQWTMAHNGSGRQRRMTAVDD